MTKERMMIFTIAMAVTIAAVFCWYYYEGRDMLHKATESKTIENEESCIAYDILLIDEEHNTIYLY